jgi:polyhydroxyalkanoate synthesis regulator phasin
VHEEFVEAGDLFPEETNMYWDEIASLCVDGESLRLQKRKLRKLLNQEKTLRMSEKPSPEDISALKIVIEKTKDTFSRIAMLEGE